MFPTCRCDRPSLQQKYDTRAEREQKWHSKRASVSVLTLKLFGSCPSHSYNEKNVNKLGINDFSQTHQRTEITEQATTLKSRETGKSRKLQLRSFSSLSAQLCCEPKTALKRVNSIFSKVNTPWSSGIYLRNARLVKHLKIHRHSPCQQIR